MAIEETDGETVIFVKSIRLKSGKVIFAHQYGKKAFPLKIRPKAPEEPRLPGI